MELIFLPKVTFIRQIIILMVFYYKNPFFVKMQLIIANFITNIELGLINNKDMKINFLLLLLILF